jgi:hypothetical protein
LRSASFTAPIADAVKALAAAARPGAFLRDIFAASVRRNVTHG